MSFYIRGLAALWATSEHLIRSPITTKVPLQGSTALAYLWPILDFVIPKFHRERMLDAQSQARKVG